MQFVNSLSICVNRIKYDSSILLHVLSRSNFNWKPLPYASFKLGKTAGNADGSYNNPVYIPLIGDGDWNVTSNGLFICSFIYHIHIQAYLKVFTVYSPSELVN